MPPKVSVLTTVYNRVRYVDECIRSVLDSTLTDYEYIIVDDRSTDGSWEVLCAWEARDKRIRIFRNDTNLGDYPNRNRAAAMATGEYLKYVDSDDVIYPHGLAVMAAMMDRFLSAGLGLSAFADPERPHPRLLKPDEAYEENFFRRDLFGRAPGSAIIRRSSFEAVHGFSGINQVGDHELWLRLAARYPIVTLPRDLVWDRTHGDQQQFYDSGADKAQMHLNIQLAALKSVDCPLSQLRRGEAVRRLLNLQARTVARMVLRGRIGEASTLRRKLGLSWMQAAGSLTHKRH